MDPDELSRICAQLRLYDNPHAKVVTVDAEGHFEAKAGLGLCLACKFLSLKLVHREAFMNTLPNILLRVKA
ncbi:conserved hypothetical protein [Ricinus communis]|uniref:Uncharacterized protein n=1 Tax=Ricinus communis TaxID=3988 RepID=B9S7E7_RICCO|nr:conserved hypothetical protein [Ricinus communis]